MKITACLYLNCSMNIIYEHYYLYTIKLGFGQNASTNAESVLLIADVESWNGRVMRNLKVQKSTAYHTSLSVSIVLQTETVVMFTLYAEEDD